MSEAAVRKFSKQRIPRRSFSNEGDSQGSSSGPKRRIADPTISLKEFAGHFLYHIVKKTLLVSSGVRAGIYLVAVIVFSVVFDLLPFPKTFLANKRSFLNVYFVKWSWGWTFCVSAFFIFYSSLILTCRTVHLMRKHLTRLAFGTAAWYLCTNTFHIIENVTGYCLTAPDTVLKNVTNRYVCTHQHKGSWLGFDISGHVFLLTWCNLVIAEEVAILRDWVKLGEYLKEEVDTGGRRLSCERSKFAHSLYLTHTFSVKVAAILLGLLSLIWDLMLCGTIIHFHSMPSKLTAVIFSLTCWALVYRGILSHGFLSSFVLRPGENDLLFISGQL